MSLPKQFIERLHQIVPPSYLTKVRDSFSLPRHAGLRVNTLLASPDDVWAQLTQEDIPFTVLPWCKIAATVEPAYRQHVRDYDWQGQVLLQNPASLIPVLSLAVMPESEVLDLAAAPGVKTSHLAAMMANTGRLAAVETVKPRFYRMLALLKQLGVSNVVAYHRDGTQLFRVCPQRFDQVLLDAPCSTEAQFIENDPRSYAHWSLKKVKEIARKQRQLLYAALACVKVGGTVVYSTCSFAPEENECQIDWALRRFSESIDVEPINLSLASTSPGLCHWQGKSLDSRCANTLRIWPNHIFSGFYVAKLVKHAALTHSV